MNLRSILDWSIAPRLNEAPGVVEVNSYGGELKTCQVALRPDALVAYGISLKDVFNVTAGGAPIVALQRLEGAYEFEVPLRNSMPSSVKEISWISSQSQHSGLAE